MHTVVADRDGARELGVVYSGLWLKFQLLPGTVFSTLSNTEKEALIIFCCPDFQIKLNEKKNPVGVNVLSEGVFKESFVSLLPTVVRIHKDNYCS